MPTCELIDLERLIRVLQEYGADKAQSGTDAKEAIKQLQRLCKYRIGEKVFVKEEARYNTWSEGVVVAYMLHAPHFVVGKGDDRDNLPEDASLFGFHPKDLRPRENLPEGGKIVEWAKSRPQK